MARVPNLHGRGSMDADNPTPIRPAVSRIHKVITDGEIRAVRYRLSAWGTYAALPTPVVFCHFFGRFPKASLPCNLRRHPSHTTRLADSTSNDLLTCWSFSHSAHRESFFSIPARFATPNKPSVR